MTLQRYKTGWGFACGKVAGKVANADYMIAATISCIIKLAVY